MSLSSSPRITKGALIGADPLLALTRVIVFQYNPDQMTRSLTPQAHGGGGGESSRSEPLRFSGPPRQTISLTVEIDATDQLEQGAFPTIVTGLHPTLAALEGLITPRSALVIANAALAAAGMLEVVPPDAPLTLLVWGVNRIAPVRITSMTITEEEFDPALNPIRAKVALSLQVLTYDDLGIDSIGGALSLSGQILKEVMATVGSVESLSRLNIPSPF